MKTHVIKLVVRNPHEQTEKLLEQLRYAGLISSPKESVFTTEKGDVYLNTLTFKIFPPCHIGPKERQGWAERNKTRMESFGFEVSIETANV